MNREALDKILERIQKLKALQEGAKEIGSLEEAENAAMHMQKLLIKYNLSMEEVKDHATKDEVGNETVQTGSKKKKSEGTWITRLYRTIANNNFCSIITISGGKILIHLIGEPHNRLVVIDLVESLIPRIRNLEKKNWSTYEGPEKRGTFRRGFLLGAVIGISSKLSEQMEAMKKEEQNLPGLILVKDAAIKKHIEEAWKNLKKKTSRGTKSQSGAIAGYQAGKDMSLNRGVAGKSGQKQIGG